MQVCTDLFINITFLAIELFFIIFHQVLHKKCIENCFREENGTWWKKLSMNSVLHWGIMWLCKGYLFTFMEIASLVNYAPIDAWLCEAGTPWQWMSIHWFTIRFLTKEREKSLPENAQWWIWQASCWTGSHRSSSPSPLVDTPVHTILSMLNIKFFKRCKIIKIPLTLGNFKVDWKTQPSQASHGRMRGSRSFYTASISSHGKHPLNSSSFPMVFPGCPFHFSLQVQKYQSLTYSA